MDGDMEGTQDFATFSSDSSNCRLLMRSGFWQHPCVGFWGQILKMSEIEMPLCMRRWKSEKRQHRSPVKSVTISSCSTSSLFSSQELFWQEAAYKWNLFEIRKEKGNQKRNASGNEVITKNKHEAQLKIHPKSNSFHAFYYYCIYIPTSLQGAQSGFMVLPSPFFSHQPSEVSECLNPHLSITLTTTP